MIPKEFAKFQAKVEQQIKDLEQQLIDERCDVEMVHPKHLRQGTKKDLRCGLVVYYDDTCDFDPKYDREDERSLYGKKFLIVEDVFGSVFTCSEGCRYGIDEFLVEVE